MLKNLQRWNLKLFAAFLFTIIVLPAQEQDPTTLLTPGVARVGEKLACRCGTCRNTVATCPMIRCHYTEPMRARIKAAQEQGQSDANILNAIVKEAGVVALAAPPGEGWGLLTWLMPGAALFGGFLVYSWWVRRNSQQEAVPVNDVDRAVLDRFRDQIDSELGEPEDAQQGNRPNARR